MEFGRKNKFSPCILALLLVWAFSTGLVRGEGDDEEDEKKAKVEEKAAAERTPAENKGAKTHENNGNSAGDAVPETKDPTVSKGGSLPLDSFGEKKASFLEYLSGKDPQVIAVVSEFLFKKVVGEEFAKVKLALEDKNLKFSTDENVDKEIKASIEALAKGNGDEKQNLAFDVATKLRERLEQAGKQPGDGKEGKDGKNDKAKNDGKEGKDKGEAKKENPEEAALKKQLKDLQDEFKRRSEAQALQDAFTGKALQDAQKQAKEGGKGGGGKGGGGDSGGKGGGQGGSPSGGDSERSEPKGLDEALKHLDKKSREPSLSEVRNQTGADKNDGRGAKDDEKKKDEGGFKLPERKSKDEDSGLKSKKELDDKSKDQTAADAASALNDPSQGAFGQKPNVKNAILSGPTSIPNAISEQYGTPSSGAFDASFGGGDSGGGMGGGTASGGGGGSAGGGGGGGGLNFGSVGQGEPYSPEPGIKTYLQSVQAGGGGDSDGGDSDSSSESGDYTSKAAVKRGEGLFSNQLVLSSTNSRTKGRGIMAYVGAAREYCSGATGKVMALCGRVPKQGEISRREK